MNGRSDKARLKIVAALILIPIGAIVVLLIWSVLFITKIDFVSPDSTLIGTVVLLLEIGLAIIGVAVSVWIGLNIYNTITKGDLSSIETTVAELGNSLSEEGKRADSLSKDLEAIQLRLRELNNNQSTTLKTSVLSSLMKTYEDKMSFYYITRISSLPTGDINPTIFSDMVYLEDTFANTIIGYRTGNRTILGAFTDSGLEYYEHNEQTEAEVHEALSKKTSLLISSYLNFRHAEFLFYKYIKHYNPPNPVEKRTVYAEKLTEAINLYQTCKEEIERYEEKMGADEGAEMQIWRSYLNNSIGYCYLNRYYYFAQKIEHETEAERMESDKHQAIKFCTYACYPKPWDIATFRPFAKAVYYRNYAHCILLDGESIAHLKLALVEFERSVSIDFRDAKSHTNVAIYTLKLLAKEQHMDMSRAVCLDKFIFPEARVSDVRKAIRHLEWSIQFNHYFSDPYFYLAFAKTFLLLTDAVRRDLLKKEALFHDAQCDLETYHQSCSDATQTTCLFYQRNLYEAYGNIEEANRINEQLLELGAKGDTEHIKALYQKRMGET